MLKKFKTYIQKEKLFTEKHTILVAVSGGVDSAVLCNLFSEGGYSFAIVHCNFQLRGKESDRDELFVRQLGKLYNVKVFVRKFDTLGYAKKHQLSVQMAARELRYDWFEEIRTAGLYDYIAVAHHQNDEIETFFVNLIRGTGIAGLHGIRSKLGKIIRPLMFAGRIDIEKYAKKKNILFREDSSNASLKYMRNKIRHQLIPILKEMNPDIEKALISNIRRVKQIENVFLQKVEEIKREIVGQEGSLVKFDISKLIALPERELFLYEFLKPYHFSGDIIESISKGLKGISGKIFFSETHRLLKDRTHLILMPLIKDNFEKEVLIDKDIKEIKEPLHIKIKKLKNLKDYPISKEDKNVASFDFDKLKFPLILRKWKKGDCFMPFGMKSLKKLSDFFTDQKISLFEKEKIWLLSNENDIIWIAGYRIDDRYCITKKTKKIFEVEVISACP